MPNTTKIKNLYHKEFKELCEKYKQPYQPLPGGRLAIKNLRRRNIGTMHDMFAHRDELIWRYSHAVPDPDILEMLGNELGNYIIEIGCGTGYWASLFAEMGKTVLAFDKYTHAMHDSLKHHTILNGDESALLNFTTAYSLFLCWPPFLEPMGHNCLLNFKGNIVAVVADRSCCGDYNMWKLLESEWELKWDIDNATWPFTSDTVAVYHRK